MLMPEWFLRMLSIVQLKFSWDAFVFEPWICQFTVRLGWHLQKRRKAWDEQAARALGDLDSWFRFDLSLDRGKGRRRGKYSGRHTTPQMLLCLAKAAASRLPRTPPNLFSTSPDGKSRSSSPSDSHVRLPARGSRRQLLPFPFGTRAPPSELPFFIDSP
jgi:hypothetical protein